MSDLTGTVLEGKYRLVCQLGEGGMGTVYEAEHTMIRRRAAVKVLLPELTDVAGMAERFLREARSASEIDHPNIIGIHDVSRSADGHLFIVMELLEGTSLRDLLVQERRLALDRATRITLEVLAGLQAAHEHGTVHRDLKPDNIFLVRDDDGTERVKILDFGISKIRERDIDEALTQTGTVLGTPHYMAPEQAHGEPDIDGRIDIWAVGIILYEMLAGSRPYDGDSYNRIISRILLEPSPRVRDVVPEVPATLAAVVERALAKDRDERYPDAAAMTAELGAVAEELQTLMSLETVITPPSGPGDVGTEPTAVVSERDGAPTARDGAEPGPDQALAVTEALEAGSEPTAQPAHVGGEALEPVAQPEAVPAPSLFKRGWWVVLCLPYPLLVLASAFLAPAALGGAVGLPQDVHPAWGYGLGLILAVGIGWASWQVYRFWAHGNWNRWLQGLGFVVFPVVGLLLVFRAHTALTGNLDAALASFRAYGPVTVAQAESLLTSLTEALADHLNAVVMVAMLVAYLALLVLLGQVFAPPGRGKSLFSWRHWLVLPAGLGVVVATHVGYHLATASSFPVWVAAAFLPWALTAIPVLRQRPGARGSAWRILLCGVVAQVAVVGVAAALGIIQMFQWLQQQPVERRAAAWEASGVHVAHAIWAIALIAVLLAVLLLAVCWRSFGWGTGPLAERLKALGVGLVMVGATALSTVILVVDNDAVQVAMALPKWKPALVEMVPAALEPQGAATFYIDRNPSSLRHGREELAERLTNASGTQDFDRAALLAALTGYAECPELLEATIGAPDGVAEASEPPPARCITAVEASLYCEARGKRLPTPAEWDGALQAVAPSSPTVVERTGPLRRGPFAEWTMERVHGTPTFHVKGGQGALEDPGQLHPTALSQHVGFRCAFRFDD